MEENRNQNPSQEAPEAQHCRGRNPPWQPETTEEEDPSSEPARSKKWYIIGALLVVFLAAAVFLGARLLNPQGAEGSLGGGNEMMHILQRRAGRREIRPPRHDAPPKSCRKDEPSRRGIFVRREDQSIFIGTGNVRMAVKKSVG